MEVLFGIGYVLGYLIGCFIIGAIAQHIAETKGYSDGFGWGFWLGIIGLIVVAVRQPIVIEPAPQPSSLGVQTWICKCGAENGVNAHSCFRCRRTRAESKEAKFAEEKAKELALAERRTSLEAADALTSLQKIAELHERGVLTDEEFQKKKAEFLAKM